MLCAAMVLLAGVFTRELRAARALTEKEKTRFQELQRVSDREDLTGEASALVERYVRYQIERLVDPTKRNQVATIRDEMQRDVRSGMAGFDATTVFRDLYAEKILSVSKAHLKNPELIIGLNLLILWEAFALEPMCDEACRLIDDPNTHEGIKYWCVRILGKLGDRRSGRGFAFLTNENRAIASILSLAANKSLHYKTRVQICKALGQIGRSDRAVRDEVVADFLRGLAHDRQQPLEVRMHAASALSGLRFVADIPVDIASEPPKTTCEKTCEAIVTVLLDVYREAGQAKDKRRRLALAEHAYQGMIAFERMPDLVKRRALALKDRADRRDVAYELGRLRWMRRQLRTGLKLVQKVTQLVVAAFSSTRVQKQMKPAADRVVIWLHRLLRGPSKTALEKAKAAVAADKSKKAQAPK